MSSLRSTIKADLLRYVAAANFRSFCFAYHYKPGFRVTFWYRLASHTRVRNVVLGKLLSFWLTRYKEKTGIQFNAGVEIGPGLYMPHYGCIVINPECRIGAQCYISHAVTLGRAHAGPRMGAPEIGDGVFIGPGAVLLGKLKVGDNAAIGANSVVISDIPANKFAAGAPAKVVRDVGAGDLLGSQNEN